MAKFSMLVQFLFVVCCIVDLSSSKPANRSSVLQLEKRNATKARNILNDYPTSITTDTPSYTSPATTWYTSTGTTLYTTTDYPSTTRPYYPSTTSPDTTWYTSTGTTWYTTTDYPSTTRPYYPSTTTSQPTTSSVPSRSSTPVGPKPFSVRLVSSNVPSEQYIIDAVGILQLYLEEYDNFDEAVNRFLTTFKEKHDTQVWKLSSGCKILTLPADLTYIKLREETTNTEVNLFV